MKPEVVFFSLGVARLYVITTAQTLTHPDRERRTFHFGANSFLCLFLSLLFIVCFRMVKVSFNSALGRKDVKNAEFLLPQDDKVSKNMLSELTRSQLPVWRRRSFVLFCFVFCRCCYLVPKLSGYTLVIYWQKLKVF